jgi:hypothetical protein
MSSSVVLAPAVRFYGKDPGEALVTYQRYFNESRPHRGIGQRVPANPVVDIDSSKPIEVISVLGGLHVDYRRAA